jgi:hypothetical protein
MPIFTGVQRVKPFKPDQLRSMMIIIKPSNPLNTL